MHTASAFYFQSVYCLSTGCCGTLCTLIGQIDPGHSKNIRAFCAGVLEFCDSILLYNKRSAFWHQLSSGKDGSWMDQVTTHVWVLLSMSKLAAHANGNTLLTFPTGQRDQQSWPHHWSLVSSFLSSTSGELGDWVGNTQVIRLRSAIPEEVYPWSFELRIPSTSIKTVLSTSSVTVWALMVTLRAALIEGIFLSQ